MVILKRLYKKIFQNNLLQGKIAKIIFFALAINLFFGTLFYWAEKNVQHDLNFLEAVWWAMVTMTTVGYGDFYAQTNWGRFLISYPCMLVGIGIIGYLVGVIAERVMEHISKKKRGLMKLKIKNHIIICNFPHLEKVLRLIQEVNYSGKYKISSFVLLTNKIDGLPEELQKLNVSFVKGDPTKEEALHRANIVECEGVFILADDPKDPASDSKTFAIGTIIEMMETEIGRPIKVVVELVSKDNLKMMQRSHVDGIVSADGIMDGLLAQEFLYPGIHDIFHQIITSAEGSQFYILDTKLQGHKISDIQIAVLRHPSNLQVIGISRGSKKYLNPPKSQVIKAGDKLIMLAERRSDFEAIERDILNKDTK